MRTRLAMTTLTAAAALGLMAGPALADHDHHLVTPGHCADIPVADQDHAEKDTWEPGSGRGAYFHSGLHMGATDDANEVLGMGNSRVEVFGGSC